MAEKSEASIRFAIQSCVIKCGQSGTPVICVAEFLEHLRRLGWDKMSVREVERGVIDTLARSHAVNTGRPKMPG